MPRDYELYIDDIRLSCNKILRYTKDMTFEDFFHNDLVYDAVLRHLIIIGEAAKNIPQNSRFQFKNIEWKKICGLRDILTHAYFGIDNSILWEIVHSKIPMLLRELTESS